MSKVYDQLKTLEARIKQQRSGQEQEQSEREPETQPAAQEAELKRVAAEREAQEHKLEEVEALTRQQEAIEEARRRTEAEVRLAEAHVAQLAQEARLEALSRERAAAEQAEQTVLAARIEAERQLIQQLQARHEQEKMEWEQAAQRAAREEELKRVTAEREAQKSKLQTGRLAANAAMHQAWNASVESDAIIAPLPAAGRGNTHRMYYFAAALLAGVAGYFLANGTRPVNEEPTAQPVTQVPVQPVVQAPAQPTEAPFTAPANQEEIGAGTQQNVDSAIRQNIQQWADAWSRQDAAAYLSFYANEFEVPEGLSRADWEAQRKSRIGKYRSIEITLRDAEISYAGGDEAIAQFTQDFLGDSYRETGVQKEFRLKNIDGRWLIVSERIF